MFKNYLKYTLLFIAILISNIVLAQGPPPPPPPPSVPINGGIIVLLLAGIGYGIKKLKEK